VNPVLTAHNGHAYNSDTIGARVVCWERYQATCGVSRMARKRAKTVQAAEPVRTGRPVRLDLTEKDHVRLEKQAKKRGLNKASTARMIILEWLDEEESEGGGK